MQGVARLAGPQAGTPTCIVSAFSLLQCGVNANRDTNLEHSRKMQQNSSNAKVVYQIAGNVAAIGMPVVGGVEGKSGLNTALAILAVSRRIALSVTCLLSYCVVVALSAVTVYCKVIEDHFAYISYFSFTAATISFLRIIVIVGHIYSLSVVLKIIAKFSVPTILSSHPIARTIEESLFCRGEDSGAD